MSEVRGVTEVNGVKEYRYFVDGEWRTAEDQQAVRRLSAV